MCDKPLHRIATPSQRKIDAFRNIWTANGLELVQNQELEYWRRHMTYFRLPRPSHDTSTITLEDLLGDTRRVRGEDMLFLQARKTDEAKRILAQDTIDLISELETGLLIKNQLRLMIVKVMSPFRESEDTKMYGPLFGIAHPNASSGDNIYYLRGCSFPLILSNGIVSFSFWPPVRIEERWLSNLCSRPHIKSETLNSSKLGPFLLDSMILVQPSTAA
jgi:hypothetical protein